MNLFLFCLLVIEMISVVMPYSLPEKCTDLEFYNAIIFDCDSCTNNQSPSTDSYSCECNSRSRETISQDNTIPDFSQIAQLKNCEICQVDQVSSRDKQACQSCDFEIPVSAAHGDCDCPEGTYIQEKNTSGDYLSIKRCVQCPEGEYQFLGTNQAVYECKKCPPKKVYDTNVIPWKCVCDVNFYVEYGGECFESVEANYLNTQFPSSGASSVLLREAETIDDMVLTSSTISESDTLKQLYFKSGFNCLKTLDRKSCQTLANLCVLQMYDLQTEPCKLYQFINDLQPAIPNKNLGAHKDMPWLYYEGNSTAIINDTEKIKFTPSFDPDDPLYVNKLDFYLATFDLEGNFLSMELLTSQLNLCSKEYDIGYLSFGTSVKLECEIDFDRFMRTNYTTHFYELFLFDPVAKSYIDVPIKINNIPNEKAAWGPNNSTDPWDWILTRRFFMVDNIAAIEGNEAFYDLNVNPSAIRYPHLLKFQVVLQNRDDPRIFVPYLELYYKTKRRELLAEVPTSIVFFEAQYTMNIDHLIYVCQSIFIALNCLIIIHVIIRMYSWYQLNPRSLSPDNHSTWMISVFFFTLFEIWGLYMFWFTICITGYFWIFLKLQYQVFILLYPENPEAWWDNNRPFDVVWGMGCSCYFFYILHRIYQQSNTDIFFIDWEHDKSVLVKSGENNSSSKYKGIWRVLFLANQLNQLQTSRRISIEFALAILAVFWYHFEWEVLNNNSATTEFCYKCPEIYLMRFFLAGIILIIIGLVYIIGRFVVDLYFPSKKILFMDLLSVCNTSLFVLDSSLHGYYVHGQSPSGKSDSSMEELLHFLDEESEGRVKNRGLVEKEDDSHQSYEMYISYKFRKSYDGLFAMQTHTMLTTAETKDQMINQSRLTSLLKVLPKNIPMNFILNLKEFMNSELKEKIQKISNQSNKYVLKKTLFQRFFGLPPVHLADENSEELIFYKDRNDSFDSVLLFGIDWEWYMLNIYIFQMWMLTLSGAGVSFMMTLLCDRVLTKIRSFCGERNISKKSIIDNKFFVSS